MTIPDPLTGEGFLKIPDTQISELGPFEAAAKTVTKSGMHNPLKNPERYGLYGNIATDVARRMAEPDVHHFFWRLIQRLVYVHAHAVLHDAEVHTASTRHHVCCAIRVLTVEM